MLFLGQRPKIEKFNNSKVSKTSAKEVTVMRKATAPKIRESILTMVQTHKLTNLNHHYLKEGATRRSNFNNRAPSNNKRGISCLERKILRRLLSSLRAMKKVAPRATMKNLEMSI